LEPRPEFQRRLVWSNKDKSAFLETVLKDYPFPEIYVAAGEVDVESGEAKEMLVDGQQRITTLYQYFTGSPDLKLATGVPSYQSLEKDHKEAFLQYDVVVRDLGRVDIDLIKEVFTRINATRYALNAMEIHNARYEGEFKNFAEQFAQHEFFQRHNVFSAGEIKRMQDTRFALAIASTVLSTYFNRDDDVEEFLKQYNDEFPHRDRLWSELTGVLDLIEDLNLKRYSRAWKQVDLFTLVVELHRAIYRDGIRLKRDKLGADLADFYQRVDAFMIKRGAAVTVVQPEDVAKYYFAALQATNDRVSRINRGEVMRIVIRAAAEGENTADALENS
jgi:hypothetical protein